MHSVAKASGSFGGTRAPRSPDRPTSSTTPPTSVLTVALPLIIASMRVSGSPSETEDRATTWPARNAGREPSLGPSQVTASSMPRLALSASRSAWYAAAESEQGPKMRNRAWGTFVRTRAKARSRVCRSFSGSIRPTKLIVGTSGSVSIGGYAVGSTPLSTGLERSASAPRRIAHRELKSLTGRSRSASA